MLIDKVIDFASKIMVKAPKIAAKITSKPIYLVILLVLVGGLAIRYQFLYRKSQKELLGMVGGTDIATVEENKKLLEKIGALTELPPNETPTIATVNDVEKLKGQTFFANAQNGDKVIIYTNAKRAVLYRPSSNKVIEIGPVNINQNVAGANTVAPNPTENKDVKKTTIKLAFFDASGKVGQTTNIVSKIEQISAGVGYQMVLNKAVTGYEKSSIIDLSKINTELVGKIAKSLNFEVGSLPAGVEAPDADILIIVGSSYILN